MKKTLIVALCCFAAATMPSNAKAPKPVPHVDATGLSQYAAQLQGEPEGFAAYVPQTSCDPKWRKGVAKFRDLVLQTYPQTKDWGSMRDCTDDGISEHLDGRAWDWNANAKNPEQFEAATDLINWLMADNAYWARRVGIMYIGYNHRIWGAYRAGDGWRKLSPSDPHTDHVHFSFSWQGAFGKTSFFDGTAATQDYGPCRPFRGEPAVLYGRDQTNNRPCSYPPALSRTSGKAGKLLWRGSRGAEVLAVQKALNVPGANGYFESTTMHAVAAWQRSKNLPATGAVDTVTRTRMVREGILKR